MAFTQDYKSQGDASRKDTFTSRVTAQVLDVKPNGTLVLEARKFIRIDTETLNIVLTGTCRKDDIASGSQTTARVTAGCRPPPRGWP